MAKKLKNLKRLTIYASEVNQSFESLKVFNKLQIFELLLNTLREEDMKVIERLDLTKLKIFSKIFNITDEMLKKIWLNFELLLTR
jgi:hypothetical protein